MKKSEKEAIIQKLKDLNFKQQTIGYKFFLPLGNKNILFLDRTDFRIYIGKITQSFCEYIPIRKIESPEDLENLFNAICPEKYRLPFN